MNALQKRVLSAMNMLAKEDSGLPSREARQAVYDMAVHKHGLEAVGAFELYLNKPHGFWTLPKCQESALKFQTRTAWQVGEKGAYNAALKHGWLASCCQHMPENKSMPAGYWTLERCQESALGYQSRKAWETGQRGAYAAALKNGWHAICCARMGEATAKPKGYWSLERCQENALAYQTRTAWSKGQGCAYDAAKKNGWLGRCCAHMTPVKNKKRVAS